MKEEDVHSKIRDLIREIAKLPEDQRKALEPVGKAMEQKHIDMKNSVDKVNDSLTDLRICLKYILFDLEATRRERDDLRRILEDKSDDSDGRMD